MNKKGAKKKANQDLADENLAQTVLIEGAEIEPVIAEQSKVETSVEEPLKDEAEIVEEKPKKSTRSRRPNRNTQKRPKTTKKATKKESTDE